MPPYLPSPHLLVSALSGESILGPPVGGGGGDGLLCVVSALSGESILGPHQPTPRH